jgi:hypothetical protein
MPVNAARSSARCLPLESSLTRRSMSARTGGLSMSESVGNDLPDGGYVIVADPNRQAGD